MGFDDGFEKEVDCQLKRALQEIGLIEPWASHQEGEWVFTHPAYPVSCCGASPLDVKKRYPLFLREFIWYKLKESRFNPTDGNRRETQNGEGLKKAVTLPKDIAEWLEADPYTHIERIRCLMRMT